MREQLLAKLQVQQTQNAQKLPIVELDDYFVGNTDEDCIAPNQVGYGRPVLADVYARFKEIQKRSDVQTVLVQMHDEWIDAIDHPTLWPAAENVLIYTSASPDEVEQWIDGLAADGALERPVEVIHPAAPPPHSRHKIYAVCWD